MTSDGEKPPLSPPWAPAARIAASVVFAIVAALVWHTRSPDPVDAQVMRWQEVARLQADFIATPIANAVGPVVVLAVLVTAVVAWRAGRRDAVVLAVASAPGAFAVELVFKEVVNRRRPDGGEALLYPSGHVAVAAAAAVTAVLVLRATGARPRTIVGTVWPAACVVLVIALARLVQTVHYVTDVVGGADIGLAVTCWVAAAIDARSRSGLCTAARSAD